MREAERGGVENLEARAEGLLIHTRHEDNAQIASPDSQGREQSPFTLYFPITSYTFFFFAITIHPIPPPSTFQPSATFTSLPRLFLNPMTLQFY